MAKAIDGGTLRDNLTDIYGNGNRLVYLNDVLDLIDEQPTLTPPNEWVSVEDAVPDPGERVLATDGTFVGEAYRTSANTWYRHTGFPWRDCLQSIVTLWMPLPTADKDNHVPAKAPNEPLTSGFDVVDTKTGEYPDLYKIALTENWAKELMYCDMEGFAIDEDGTLLLLDECGSQAYCPPGRFEVRLLTERREDK